MSHRLLLVAGSPVERSRLEGSLRNAGTSVLSAENAQDAALLVRQFGPSALLLLDEPSTVKGKNAVAVLQSQKATANVPLVVIDDGLSAADAAMLLRSACALVPPQRSGGELISVLSALFGDDPRDPRRHLAFHRRGPAMLRRIGDHLRQARATGLVLIDDGKGGGQLSLSGGRLEDASYGPWRGGAAIKAMLSSDATESWAITYRGAAPASSLAPSKAPTLDLDVSVVEAEIATVVGEVISPEEILEEVLVEEVLPLGHEAIAAKHDKVSLSVVIVDDDPALTMLYQKVLENAGHKVGVAKDGAIGIALTKQLEPDIVVSDIAMPNTSGWDLLAAVRADPRVAEVPIVLLSAHGDFLRGLARAAAGANDYIEKGLRTAALVERVERAAAVRAALKSWGTEPPPSFQARSSEVGLFALARALEHSSGSGSITIDDGWTRVDLHIHHGKLAHARAREADGTEIDGDAAIATALEHSEADLTFTRGDDAAPPNTTSFLEALVRGAAIVEERRALHHERALGGDAALIFREAAAHLYFIVADPAASAVAERLQQGTTPRQLLEQGTDPLVVESVVNDLLRKGVADLLA